MKTILIIDDEYDIVNSLEMVFTLEGYSVALAFHGAEALDVLRGGLNPDIIVSDVMMPVLDGYAFVQALREEKKHQDIPLILMSAAQLDLSKLRVGSYQLYVRKPFDLNRLLLSVTKLLSRNSGTGGAL